METKTLQSEGTILATVKAAKGDGPGEFEAVLSMPTLDRDGEIIDAKAFEPLPERITIDVDHTMSVQGTVGSGAPFYEGDVLKVKGTFASTDLAQSVRTLVTEGHIGHMSVAYMNAKYETDDTDGVPHLRSGELLNAAIVGIPSNREAAILAAKSIEQKVGRRDLARVQSAHDLMVELGAACDGKSHTPEHTKSTATDPEHAAADEAAAVPADVNVARARVELALAEVALAL